MALAPQLNSPVALLHKLERESYRAYHAESLVAKSDHFFNFCVTAASMRDYCLEYLGKLEHKDQQPFHELWDQYPTLVAAKEIANSAKHFVLRDRRSKSAVTPKTRAVGSKLAKFVDVYEHADGRTFIVPTQRREVFVTLANGEEIELYAFTGAIVEYWRRYLRSIGLNVLLQAPKRLSPK